MRYLALFLLFFIATPAFAQWQDSTIGTGLDFDLTQPTDVIGFHAVFNSYQFRLNDGFTNLPFTQNNTGTTLFYGASQVNYPVVLLFVQPNTCLFNDGFTNLTLALNGCASDILFYSYVDQGATCAGLGSTVECLALPPPPPLNLTWGSNNGFFGNSTPAQVGASVIDGVQDTGANLWPLLIFLGVSLAFIIFVQVVALTRHTTRIKETTRRKNAVFNDNKADELKEYYSKDGNAPNWLVEKIRGKKDT